MTVHDGRRASADGPLSLFDHARRLLARHPDGPLPHGGRPYPDEPAQPTGTAGRRPTTAARQTLHATLNWFFAQPPPRPVAELNDRLSTQQTPRRWLGPVLADLPGATEDRRETGRWLARHATDRRSAAVGLALLRGTARPEDAPLIRTLGLLDRLFGVLAAEVLAALPAGTRDVIWLADRLTGHQRAAAVRLICEQDDPAAAGWLLRHGLPAGEDGNSSALARQIAEATGLATVLRGAHLDAEVVHTAARVLLTMAVPGYEPARVADWPGATGAVADLARHLAAGTTTLDDAAYAVRLAEELTSGHLALLDWPPGRRADLVGALTAVGRRGLDGPVPTAGTRAAWRVDWLTTALAGLAGPAGCDRVPAATDRAGGVRRGAPVGQPPVGEPAPDRLRLRVVVPDPALPADVELRPLVNDVPVVARAFDRGHPEGPEPLLDALTAGVEPHRVRLAEAACTEGCCGALWTTVDRVGDRVRWHGWRGPDREDPLPAFGFDAGTYQAELDRVARDHSWEWPARTLARLLRQRLAAEPDVLGRWDCRFAWVRAPAAERDRTELLFTHPDRECRLDRPWLQFRLEVRPGDDPAGRVESLVDELHRLDPKRTARIVGGSPANAAELGFRWPDPR